MSLDCIQPKCSNVSFRFCKKILENKTEKETAQRKFV